MGGREGVVAVVLLGSVGVWVGGGGCCCEKWRVFGGNISRLHGGREGKEGEREGKESLWSMLDFIF